MVSNTPDHPAPSERPATDVQRIAEIAQRHAPVSPGPCPVCGDDRMPRAGTGHAGEFIAWVCRAAWSTDTSPWKHLDASTIQIPRMTPDESIDFLLTALTTRDAEIANHRAALADAERRVSALHALVCNAFGYDKSIVRTLALWMRGQVNNQYRDLAQRVMDAEEAARIAAPCHIVHPLAAAPVSDGEQG